MKKLDTNKDNNLLMSTFLSESRKKDTPFKDGRYIVNINGVKEEKDLTAFELFKIWYYRIYNPCTNDNITTFRLN